MVRRHELSDAQWQQIEPWLPANGRPGGQWSDHGRVINGVLFRARTGAPWPDQPERYGPWQTLYERHRRWSADGTWRRIPDELQTEADATDPDGALERSLDQQRKWAVNIDSAISRTHQHAAGARHCPPCDFPQGGRIPCGGRWRCTRTVRACARNGIGGTARSGLRAANRAVRARSQRERL